MNNAPIRTALTRRLKKAPGMAGILPSLLMLLMLLILLVPPAAKGQPAANSKTYASSYSRGILSLENLEERGDSSIDRMANPGHVLTDVGIHLNPHSALEVHAQMRIRSEYGGFWGSGLTLDLRQMWIRGVIDQKIRYQVGDLDYRLSPFTLQQSEEWILSTPSLLFSPQLDMIRYDLFQSTGQTRRQQGIAVDFGWSLFSDRWKWSTSLFTTRIAASDFNQVPDRLMSGGAGSLSNNRGAQMRIHYVDLYDVEQTAANTRRLRHPVGSLRLSLDGQRFRSSLPIRTEIEFGRSKLSWDGQADAPQLTDGFAYALIEFSNPNRNRSLSAEAWRVGSDYRSAGAQTKRIDFDRSPAYFRRLAVDDQIRALNMLDLYRDGSLHRFQVQTGLMNYDPAYGNALPYGIATPNRQGVMVQWKRRQPAEGLHHEGKLGVLSDVKGQGIAARRRFVMAEWNASAPVHEWLGWKKSWWIRGMARLENTARTDGAGDLIDTRVNLNNRQGQIQSEWQLSPDWQLFAEWRQYSSSGHDFYAVRNAYSEVIDYLPLNLERSEQWSGFGLNYQMSTRFQAQCVAYRYRWTPPAGTATPALRWNSVSLLLVMKL
jgi:hypothetical protein